MDSLFLSPLKEDEVWDFHAVSQFQLGSFGFFALRAFLRQSFGMSAPQATGLSRHWRSHLAKVNLDDYPIQFLDFIPSLVSSGSGFETEFLNDAGFEKRISLRYEKEGKATMIHMALGSEQSMPLGVSEFMQDFLSFSQKEHSIETAYIRKENSSYLYMNGREGNPRVFYRESNVEYSNFLFLVANLEKKKSLR